MHTISDRVAAARLDAGMTSMADSARALARSKEELLGDFRQLIREGEALLRSTASLSGEALGQARDRFRETLSDAKVRVGEASRVAMDRGREAVAATDSVVRANPWWAVGLAAGLGFVLGALLVRR
jgi:ElaB/YqjD/DUF883 family membrane-anchored ribosome-binding protein